MSKWLMAFESQIETPTVTVHDNNCNNCTNCTVVPSEKNELHALNERWQKAHQLEQTGFFNGKNPEYQEKICQELRKICSRASDLYDVIVEACPDIKPYLLSLELFN